jgi:hypothetical protein
VLVAGIAGLVSAGGCSEAVRQGTGSAMVVMESLLGAPGGTTSPTYGNVLQSDVSTNGGVFEDPGRVTLRLVAKDISSPLTTNNLVTINRYRVVFRRADGRNQQGVDVPYAFDGAVSFSIGTESATAGFTLVRAQAKLEAPLLTLVNSPAVFGGGIVISTLADVTFYGQDTTGHEVSVQGTISVNFADWADKD